MRCGRMISVKWKMMSLNRRGIVKHIYKSKCVTYCRWCACAWSYYVELRRRCTWMFKTQKQRGKNMVGGATAYEFLSLSFNLSHSNRIALITWAFHWNVMFLLNINAIFLCSLLIKTMCPNWIRRGQCLTRNRPTANWSRKNRKKILQLLNLYIHLPNRWN